MENTGRITRTVKREALRILYGDSADALISRELPTIAQIDRAHVVMLARAGIIDKHVASALLSALEELRASDFAPLRGRPAPRGAYILYEDHLIASVSMAVGGMLQAGRSRNDLNATAIRMRLRAPASALLREALRLQAVLLRRARRYAGVAMPSYTQYQAALPVTYGHYLAGAAAAFARDLDGIASAFEGLDDCPLGAGAVGGTSFPIRPELTARLLGFERCVMNSIDAVASRDFVLRLLGSASILGATLSRIAGDALLWTTAEFAFLALPDHLVGSSSMMPQKRNPYFLEHVQGKACAALGAFTHAITATHAKPFSNMIAVGTESVAPIWEALRQTTEAVSLLRMVLAQAEPQQAAMLARAEAGYVTATELANRLVREEGMSFREAHHAVGSVVRDAVSSGASLTEAAARWKAAGDYTVSLTHLDPASVARASGFGGGPSASSIAACVGALEARWSVVARAQRARAERWRLSCAALDEEVRSIYASRAAAAEPRFLEES